MDTNAGRNIVINENNKWYYFAYAINGCDIEYCGMPEAIENLEKYIKTIYSNDDTIDTTNFEYMIAYDGLIAYSLLDIINSDEIKQGITQGDLTTMHFICDTDTIKRGEN